MASPFYQPVLYFTVNSTAACTSCDAAPFETSDTLNTCTLVFSQTERERERERDQFS